MKFTGFLCASIAVAAAVWMPYEQWKSMTEGLLVFLGLLVAALVQVIPVTANFLQADKLTPQEARKLCTALEKQQRYWLGLLATAVMTCATLILGMAFGTSHAGYSLTIKQVVLSLNVSQIFSGVSAGLLSLVFIKTLGFFPGVLSLQQLRSQLVIDAATREQAEKAQKAVAAVETQASAAKSIVPPDYGRLFKRPH